MYYIDSVFSNEIYVIKKDINDLNIEKLEENLYNDLKTKDSFKILINFEMLKNYLETLMKYFKKYNSIKLFKDDNIFDEVNNINDYISALKILKDHINILVIPSFKNSLTTGMYTEEKTYRVLESISYIGNKILDEYKDLEILETTFIILKKLKEYLLNLYENLNDNFYNKFKHLENKNNIIILKDMFVVLKFEEFDNEFIYFDILKIAPRYNYSFVIDKKKFFNIKDLDPIIIEKLKENYPEIVI